jgi:hypothetical protein
VCYVQEDDPVLANGLPKVALEVVVVQPHEPSRAGQANRGTQNKQEDKETLHLDANGNVGVEKGSKQQQVGTYWRRGSGVHNKCAKGCLAVPVWKCRVSTPRKIREKTLFFCDRICFVESIARCSSFQD